MRNDVTLGVDMNLLDLAIDVLAATRLTRLVIEDSFPPVQALRDRIVDAHTERGVELWGDVTMPDSDSETGYRVESQVIGYQDKPDSWAELITCPWCAGMWISLGVVVARRVAPRAWSPLAKALATSMVVGLVESKIDT